MLVYVVNVVVLYMVDGFENFYCDVLLVFEKKEGVKVNIVMVGSGEVVNCVNIEKNFLKVDVIVMLLLFIQ